jgi:hypothetical protein
MYDSYSFTTSALDGDEWLASRPDRALPPGKGPPVPIVQEPGWAPEPVWTQRLEEKSFRLCRGSNLDLPVVQPVARHYTDWATRVTITNINKVNVHICIYVYVATEQGAGLAQSVQCLTTDWATGVRTPEHTKDFPLVSVPRPALTSTQPPIRWVPFGACMAVERQLYFYFTCTEERKSKG